MYSRSLRIVITIFCVAVGSWEFYRGRFVPGVMLLVVALLMLYGYFRYGTVWLALRRLRAGDEAGGARLLSQVSNPELLSARQRAYYELAQGTLALESGDASRAIPHLQAALEHRLRTEHDRAIAEANLASALVATGEVSHARLLIRAARGRGPRPEIEEMLDALEAQLGPAA